MFFLSSGSNHTTSWHDARSLCQKDTQESHKRSGCRACGNWNHGKNGLFTLNSKHTLVVFIQLLLLASLTRVSSSHLNFSQRGDERERNLCDGGGGNISGSEDARKHKFA